MIENYPYKAWAPPAWDQEADLVVVGYGGSGATCAATATALGEDVLVLEKADRGGGNSVCVAGSLLTFPVDDEKAFRYLDWMCAGQTEPAVLRAFIDGMKTLPQFQSQLGFEMKENPEPFRADGFFPEYPGAPGAEGLLGLSAIKAPGGAALYESIAALAENRGARIQYGARVVALVQDPSSGEIHGVVAETSDGARITVRSRKATILATGGFEFNERMRQQYLTHCPVLFLGSPELTGDGIELAQEAGAQLWHMNSVSGPLYWGIEPEPGRVYVTYDFMQMSGFGHRAPAFKDAGSVIWVDKNARRFHNETTETGEVHHGYSNRESWFRVDVDSAEFAHVPAFQIFDAKAFHAGAVMTTLNSRTPAWSDDNRAELDDGWIVRADTLEELAHKCRYPEAPGSYRAGYLDAAQLVSTVEEYNRSCVSGESDAFGRSNYRAPLGAGPYYAVGPMLPTFVNTHGGPKHDSEQRVLDHRDRVIQRLYAIGECGSLWGPYYNSMGDIAEFLISGQIAARSASALTPRPATVPAIPAGVHA
ncbi:FAD-binding protein [Arthrobacter sp. zg-Y1219]|uniref:FAD-dependent oxidoreductase n=1 Tax=Arthrobacter sp. zg-Y1219 TaxID=3049067 RepID=UPI0024C3925C|nr:FAD-binding protein [Arthrobacter sp. zg-Y1219]MDK1361683.1 FAD-binding protein [Arthrobacter sp. zg-Y1219]